METSRKKTKELLDQFCAVTGASRDVGKQLLEACDGNLQLAVEMHMEGGGGSSLHQEDGVRAPIPQTQEILVEDPVYAVNFRGRKRKARSVFDGFRDFQEEARQQEEQMMAGASGSRVSRKTKTLQDLFRPPIDMTYKGTFANARETGINQGKWLMVNIQNVQEFTCQALNRDVWSNTAVKTIIKENFIFWQVYHDSEEGEKYTQFYKIDDWPYVAVLDPQTGEKLVSWSSVDSLSFCDLVTEFLSQHPTMESRSPAAKRTKRKDTIVDASEDDQLEAAIQASLTDVKKPEGQTVCVDSDIDSDSDLETFSDSEDNSQLSPAKSNKSSTPTKSQRKCSSPSNNKGSSSNRNDSPCPTTSDNDSAKRPKSRQRSCSPANNKSAARNSSPKRVVKSSSSPKRSCSPLCPTSSSSPVKKSDSIHNDVHPAVIENVKKCMTQDEVNDKDITDNTNDKSECEGSNTSESAVSVEDYSEVCTDTRDYKQYLGKDTDDKATLMLRFPNGDREKLSIPFSSKLLAVVLFANSKGFSHERFELVAHYPVRQLSQFDFDSTLKDIGLHAQETIFVQARA